MEHCFWYRLQAQTMSFLNNVKTVFYSQYFMRYDVRTRCHKDQVIPMHNRIFQWLCLNILFFFIQGQMKQAKGTRSTLHFTAANMMAAIMSSTCLMSIIWSLIIDIDFIPFISIQGQTWKRARSTLAPTFTAAKMRKMSGIMGSTCSTLMQIIKEQVALGLVE